MRIGIVGAGPRGLLTLERLVAWSKQEKTALTIDLFDLNGIGGVVWQPNQPYELIMNTASDMISLFEDDSVDPLQGPLTEGPNLYTWAKGPAEPFIIAHNQMLEHHDDFLKEIQTIAPNGYTTRALYGVYLAWYYEQIVSQLPDTITVTFHEHNMVIMDPRADGTFHGETLYDSFDFDGVFIATGYSENRYSTSEAALADYASDHDLAYIPPRNPANANLSAILPGTTVIARGLGLSFFDYVTMLTSGRGGTFSQNPDLSLTYHPSGLEPKIVGMSRRGWPYHAKGRNEKGYGEQDDPRFLTADFFARYDRKHSLPFSEFWDKLQLELNYVYYSLWFQQNQPDQWPSFEQTLLNLSNATTIPDLLTKYGVPKAQRLDLESLTQPTLNLTDDQVKNFSIAVASYLRQDAAAAELGTKTGPLTSALEAIRDLRTQIRRIIEGELFTDEDYINKFTRQYNGVNNFLSIGPPLQRIRELAALTEAGIVSFPGPDATLSTANGKFRLDSVVVHGRFWLGETLLESRLPQTTAHEAVNPLLSTMLANETIHIYELQEADGTWVSTGAVAVDRHTNQVLDGDNNPILNLFVWGVPTESLHWLTTASPRPGTNDFFLVEGDRMVATFFDNLKK
ncbi:MAG: FAD/NAD(P)-binding protein [Lactobacillus sp.]|nr:FAD/NAD(P)-binding protein [Lactobacillus sp.]